MDHVTNMPLANVIAPAAPSLLIPTIIKFHTFHKASFYCSLILLSSPSSETVWHFIANFDTRYFILCFSCLFTVPLN